MPTAKHRTVVPTVFVIDPDPGTGAVVRDLLHGAEFAYEGFNSARAFFAAFQPSRRGCLILESRIPDMGGLQIQRRLAALHAILPLIFVTAKIDVSTAVELMRGGAVHVLEKPPRSIELWNAIQEAMAVETQRRAAHREREQRRTCIAALTGKERQVLKGMAHGKEIKVIAEELGISVRAVQLRRKAMMEKLELRSVPELLRFSLGAFPRSSPAVAPSTLGPEGIGGLVPSPPSAPESAPDVVSARGL